MIPNSAYRFSLHFDQNDDQAKKEKKVKKCLFQYVYLSGE
jgi:hypothetical protein